MAIPIMIPSSAELGSQITLVRWLVRSGDTVETGTPLAEIEADKGILEVEAPGPGTVLATFHAVGETVAPGTILGYLGRPGEAAQPRTARSRAQADAKTPRPAAPADAKTPRPAAPAVRRMAASLGIDLETLTATGAGGVVTRRDVEAAAARGTEAPGAAVGRPLSPNQRAIAAQVSRSHREIPPVHFCTSVDARRAAELRAEGIGYTALFVYAVSRALVRFPVFRSRLQGERIVAAEGAHVAFAVAAEPGGELYTPVVRDAGALDLKAIDARVRELAAAARERRLEAESFDGGSFLVTNLGMFPVETFDPVIYPGHSGALAVGAIRPLPAAVPGRRKWTVEIRPTLSLTLAVDHRMINGLQAAQALGFVKDLVEGGAS